MSHNSLNTACQNDGRIIHGVLANVDGDEKGNGSHNQNQLKLIKSINLDKE